MITVSPAVPDPVKLGALSRVSNGVVVSVPTAKTLRLSGAIVSKVIFTVIFIKLPLVGFIALISRVLFPSMRLEFNVTFKLHTPSITPVPTSTPEPSRISMRFPGAPVSITSGVEIFVRYGSVVSPPILVTSGVCGTVVSIVKVTLEIEEICPTSSVRVILKVVTPSGKSEVGINEYSPKTFTTHVPTSAQEPSVMVNIVPASPVPEIVGVVSGIVPLTIGVRITGLLGVIVSTSRLEVRGVLSFPTLSIAKICKGVDPSRSVVSIIDQFPDISTAPVPKIFQSPSSALTISPVVPDPVSVGVVLLVI